MEDCKPDCYCKVFFEEARTNSVIYSAIKALMNLVQNSTEKTYSGLMKEIEPSYDHLVKVATKSGLLHGKTVLTLKAVCAIYQKIVRQVYTLEEGQNIERIKDKIYERSNILA